MTIFRYATKGVSLRRDEEEDLIDCDDADIDMEPTPWVLHQARASADENENLQ